MLFRKICLLNHLRTCTSAMPAQTDVLNILNTYLQISPTVMNRIKQFNIDNDMKKVSINHVVKNCIILKNRDVNLENIQYLGKCLIINPQVLRSRIDILQELGLKSIGLDEIYRFSTLMRKSVTSFKQMYNIPMEQDIMHNVFSNAGVTLNHTEWKTEKPVRNMKIGCYYKLCAITYKSSYLKLQNQTYDLQKRWRYYSITEISKVVTLLRENCGFDVTFLQKYPQLLNLQASNVEEFLTVFETAPVFDKKLVKILRSYPKLLFYSTDKVKKFLSMQKELKIPTVAIRYCPTVLGMKTQIFLERYNNIGNSSDLGMWVQHPRVMNMICRYHLVQKRRQNLRSSDNVNNVTINTYLTHDKHFNKILSGESYRIASKKYLQYILDKELGHANISLVKKIAKHPHWKYIPLSHMENMIQYLKTIFSVEDICANIQIILYPWFKIVKVLKMVEEEYASKIGYNFTPKQHLALCLYELEKKHHFSGDAVWQHGDSDIRNLSSNSSKDVNINEFCNNIKYLNIRDDKCVDKNEVAWIEYLLSH